MTYERTPDLILNDLTHIGDISKRLGPVNVESLRRRNENRALYDASDIAEAHQFAPGAECVGSDAETRDGLPIVEVDFRKGVLSARMPDSIDWTTCTALHYAAPSVSSESSRP